MSKIKSLEEIAKQIQRKKSKEEKYIGKISYPDKIVYYIKSANLEELPLQNKSRDPKSGAFVFQVPPSFLPSGNGWRALGMYDPLIHTFYIANDLSLNEKEYTYHHEVAHALGITDENIADSYAISKTGLKAA